MAHVFDRKAETMNIGQIAAIVLVLEFAFVSTARANLVFFEAFDVDTTSTAQTLSEYSSFSLSGGGANALTVDGGVFHLPMQPVGGLQQVSMPGFQGDLTINVDLGKNPGGETFYVGLVIGDNRLLFHPGTTSPHPDGAFRVEGPGGFANQDMGFVPAGGNALHEMQVTIVEATGQFNIVVTDGNNALNTYATSFLNPGYTPGDQIGFVTNGVVGAPGDARFDNLSIFSSVPEPSGFFFFAIGMGILGIRRRTRG